MSKLKERNTRFEKINELMGCSKCRFAGTWSNGQIYCLHPTGPRLSMGGLHCANQRIPIPKKSYA